LLHMEKPDTRIRKEELLMVHAGWRTSLFSNLCPAHPSPFSLFTGVDGV
jgi:hypothetical protein